jgi:hypothetical protein
VTAGGVAGSSAPIVDATISDHNRHLPWRDS